MMNDLIPDILDLVHLVCIHLHDTTGRSGSLSSLQSSKTNSSFTDIPERNNKIYLQIKISVQQKITYKSKISVQLKCIYKL